MFVVLYVAAGVVLGWFKRIITQNIIAQRVNRHLLLGLRSSFRLAS